MERINPCIVTSGQHFWVKLEKNRRLQSYSCPMCSQLVYWSETLLSWVKPGTSGGKKIKGNAKPTN